MTAPLIFDCSQLFSAPVATGIQRVVRRLLQQWPADGPPLHVARFNPAVGLIRVSDEAVALLQDMPRDYDRATAEELGIRLVKLSPPDQPALPASAPVLLPEVFYDTRRSLFYDRLLAAHSHPVAMLAYDFMPFLQPWHFETRSVHSLMDYLRLLTMATDLAFISTHTRDEYTTRIVRGKAAPNAGPVLRLGSDGLTSPKQKWHPGRNSFVCLGTIERRKNLHLVVECFQMLWHSGHKVRLVMLGHHFGPTLPSWMVEAREHPNFTWIEAPSDNDIAVAMQDARATIFASETEGFGLPPVESLHIGVPVITYADVPSLWGLGDAGLIRLPRVTVESLKSAVSVFLDDTKAKAFWKQADTLKLPQWADFARDVADWCRHIVDRVATP